MDGDGLHAPRWSMGAPERPEPTFSELVHVAFRSKNQKKFQQKISKYDELGPADLDHKLKTNREQFLLKAPAFYGLETPDAALSHDSFKALISSCCSSSGQLELQKHAGWNSMPDFFKYCRDNHPLLACCCGDSTGVMKKWHRFMILFCYLAFHYVGSMLIVMMMRSETYCQECPSFYEEGGRGQLTYDEVGVEGVVFPGRLCPSNYHKLPVGFPTSSMSWRATSRRDGTQNQQPKAYQGYGYGSLHPYPVDTYDTSYYYADVPLLNRLQSRAGLTSKDLSPNVAKEQWNGSILYYEKYNYTGYKDAGPCPYPWDHSQHDSCFYTREDGRPGYGDEQPGGDLFLWLQNHPNGLKEWNTDCPRNRKCDNLLSNVWNIHGYNERGVYISSSECEKPEKNASHLGGVCCQDYMPEFEAVRSDCTKIECRDHTNFAASYWGMGDANEDYYWSPGVAKHGIGCCDPARVKDPVYDGIDPDEKGSWDSKPPFYHMSEAERRTFFYGIVRSVLAFFFINLPAHWVCQVGLTKCFTCPALVGRDNIVFKCCKCLGKTCASCCFCCTFLITSTSLGGYFYFKLVSKTADDFELQQVKLYTSQWMHSIMVSEVKWFGLTILQTFNPCCTFKLCCLLNFGQWNRERQKAIALINSFSVEDLSENPMENY